MKKVKVMASKLLSTAVLLFFFMLVPAVVGGTMPMWAALLLGVVALLGLNAACGVLLDEVPPAEESVQPKPAEPAARTATLRVVHGGRAA